MLPFGFFQGCSRLIDGLLPAFAFLLPGGFFLPALAFTPPFHPVCIENLIRVDDVMESPKLAE